MTPERRAEFDELVDALERAYGAFLTVPFGRRSEALSEKLIAARARVLALYAERQGEVYEVLSLGKEPGAVMLYPDGREWEILRLGDKVRVTKVEEGQ